MGALGVSEYTVGAGARLRTVVVGIGICWVWVDVPAVVVGKAVGSIVGTCAGPHNALPPDMLKFMNSPHKASRILIFFIMLSAYFFICCGTLG